LYITKLVERGDDGIRLLASLYEIDESIEATAFRFRALNRDFGEEARHKKRVIANMLANCTVSAGLHVTTAAKSEAWSSHLSSGHYTSSRKDPGSDRHSRQQPACGSARQLLKESDCKAQIRWDAAKRPAAFRPG
jgi:hypothetical protein